MLAFPRCIAIWAICNDANQVNSIEVLFVPLPVNEMEERRRRLRGLLVTGAMRLSQKSDRTPTEPETPESVNVQVMLK